MACPQCKVNPRAHSFVLFGTHGPLTYFYTAAGKAEELVDTPQKFGYFKMHMDAARGTPWVWVFDCGGMSTRHYSSIDFMKSLVGTLSNEHADYLQGIWIINGNGWMRMAVTIMSPFMNKKIVAKLAFVDSITFLERLQSISLTSLPWKSSNI